MRLSVMWVGADRAAARSLEVQYTPTFVINGRRVVGVHPIEDLRAMIDTALAERL